MCKLRIVSGEGDRARGAVYENVIAQELTAHGCRPCYYNSRKKGELDFIIEQEGKALPIEVKSGKDYERHSALDNILGISEYGIDRAVVLSPENVKRDGKLVYLPVYMVMFLSDNPEWTYDISPARFSFS